MWISLIINSGIKLLAAVLNNWASDILLNLICTKPIDYKFKFVIYSGRFSLTSKIYNKLGQHNYKTEDPENITEDIGPWIFHSEIKMFCYEDSSCLSIYIGQLKAGDDKREGVGICVWSIGDTQYLIT